MLIGKREVAPSFVSLGVSSDISRLCVRLLANYLIWVLGIAVQREWARRATDPLAEAEFLNGNICGDPKQNHQIIVCDWNGKGFDGQLSLGRQEALRVSSG